MSNIIILQKFGYAAFGYDVGIYKRILVDYATNIQVQPPFFWGYITYILTYLGFSTDAILMHIYAAIPLVICCILYAYTKKITQKTAIASIAVFLFATSLTQFDFFWWYYYRNILALCCILAFLYCVHIRSGWISVVMFMLVSIHPISAVTICIAYGYFIGMKDRSYLRFSAWICLGILVSALVNIHEWTRYFHIFLEHMGSVHFVQDSTSWNELTGQFITIWQYLLYSLLYSIFGIIGFFRYRKTYPLLSIYFITLVLGYIAQLLLYRRLIVYIDVVLIVFASMYIYELLSTYKKYHTVLIAGIYCLYICGVFIFHSISKVPTIEPSLLKEIVGLEIIIPKQSKMLTVHSIDAPWILGFSGQHTVIAPGVFDANAWDKGEWSTFWYSHDHTQRVALLSEYLYDTNQLYIFGTKEKIDEFISEYRLRQITEHTYIYVP